MDGGVLQCNAFCAALINCGRGNGGLGMVQEFHLEGDRGGEVACTSHLLTVLFLSNALKANVLEALPW